MTNKLLFADTSTASKILRAWYRNHIYRVFLYRELLKKVKASNGREQSVLQRRFQRADNALSRHDGRGKELGLSNERIVELNRLITEKNIQGKTPKQIIEELGLSKKDESPPSSSWPYRLEA